MSDILKVVGIDSKGYGKIPKLVMQDSRLTIEAKCIYAYFASYAGAGTSSFPSVSKILHDLNVSKDRYYKHFRMLTTNGYITVEQVKDNHKFSHNIYVLNCQVGDPSCPCFKDTEIEDARNTTTNNNNLKKNSINKKKIKKEKDTKGKYEDFYL